VFFHLISWALYHISSKKNDYPVADCPLGLKNTLQIANICDSQYRCVMGTDGIQSLRRNYVSPSRPYLGMMPWRSSEARAPSCQPWPLYLSKMWPREQTKVIMVNLVSRRRTMAVLSSLSTSVSVALLTLKMYRHSVSIFFLLI
jgi:hypothetical protein